jgi:type VI secretion system protein ImpH
MEALAADGRRESGAVTRELKVLVAKLNPTCRRALESASALCARRTNPNVEIEHLLRTLVDLPATDVASILDYCEIDVAELKRQLDAAIENFRRGSSGTPAMSAPLVSLLREGWMATSLIIKSPATRSGGLFFALFDDGGLRESIVKSCPILETIARESLRETLVHLTRETAEATAAKETYGWKKKRSVADGLFEEGHRFAFMQAVRLLEELYLNDDRTAPGEGADPEREVVRFRHEVRMDFPPTDVEHVTYTASDPPAEMIVNVLGLAGVLGPLPQPVSELVIERAFRKDTAFRDFLDIFNHRLISLLYRARKKSRPALDPHAPDRGGVARVLHAFLGLGTPHLLGRMDMRDRALLPYAGLLLDRHRSTIGLVRLLEDYFEVGVSIVPFRGEWHQIEDDDTTAIGETGRNQVLGRGAVLGGHVWDEAAGIEVRLGPLTLYQFRSFLPNGRAFRALAAAIRFYLRDEVTFAVRLTIAAGEVPGLYIGKRENAHLGWTTWLGIKQMNRDDSQVRVTERV